MKFGGRLRAALAIGLVWASEGTGWGQTTGGAVAGQSSVRPGKVVVLAIADCTERGGNIATGSGLLTQSAIRDGLVARGFAPFTSDSSSVVEAVREAKELAYDYILKGKLTECEDNATAWSGKRDSIAISVELYDLTPTLLASASHRQRGSSFALTDSTPDRLFVKAVAAALGRLVGSRR